MLPCSMSQIPSLFTRYCDLITCNLIAAVPPHPTGYPAIARAICYNLDAIPPAGKVQSI